MNAALLLIAGTEKQFPLGFLIRRDRARIFQVVAIKRGKWRRQIANQIAWRTDDRARFLFHNGPDSLPQPVGHPLSDRVISVYQKDILPTSTSTLTVRAGIGCSLYIVGFKRVTYNIFESFNLIVRQFVQATLIALCFGQFPTVLLTEPNEAVGDRIGQLDNTSHLAPRFIITQQELQFRRQIAVNCALNKTEEGFCHRRTINRTVEIRGIMLDVHLAIAVE